MSGAIDRIRSIYVTGLRNQHAVENQAIELLERQVGRLDNYPAMRDRMQKHIQESRDQARRLEELLSHMGTSESALKDAALSFLGNMLALGHAPAQDEVLKNSFANFAFEHYEIASYKALLTLADLTSHHPATSALRQSLAEEQAMAQWINEHLDETARTYAERYAKGETSGR